MKVRWLRGGMNIPGVGMIQEGKLSKSISKEQAEEFVGRGLAEHDQPKVKSKVKEEKGGKS